MTGLTPYLFFPGNAAEALHFYAAVFGGELSINTYAEFGRTDGPANATAHGMLMGRVELFAADAGPGEEVVACDVADMASVARAVAGIDVIVHLAAVPDEDDWERLMPANIAGAILQPQPPPWES